MARKKDPPASLLRASCFPFHSYCLACLSLQRVLSILTQCRLNSLADSHFSVKLKMKRYSRIVVLVTLLALITCAWLAYHEGVYVTTVLHANEDVLKKDRQTLREAIDDYTLAKQQAPNSLQDLADAHYLRQIPVDPITRQKDWVLHRSVTTIPPALLPPGGVDDVHSASTKIANDGTPYNTC
jgi:general secretion pathway protein G